MLTTDILGVCLPWNRWPQFSMVSVQYSTYGPLCLWPVITERKKISPGIPSFTTQTRKIWKACINVFYILAVVLIRNLIPHRRRTMSPYGLFSYVARPPTSLVDRSLRSDQTCQCVLTKIASVYSQRRK